jgi:hypothetical protein
MIDSQKGFERHGTGAGLVLMGNLLD